jgi:hypothetical protein
MDVNFNGLIKGAIGGFGAGFILQCLVTASQVASIGAGVPSELILPVTFLAGCAAGIAGLIK